ncbi:MAG: ABC transporter permease [Gaiellales bacterium]
MSGALAADPRRRAGHRARFGYLADVAVHLVRTDLATRHRGSALGWLWALAPPVMQLVATYFVFTRVIPLDVEDYPVFLLVGILSWNWFARSLNDGAVAFEQRRELVRRPGFENALLPIVSVLVAAADYLFAVPVMLVAVALTAGLNASALVFPVLVVLQGLYCVGLAMLVAPLQVFLRDVRQIVGLLVSVGFWITPIFYGRAQVPDSLSWIYTVNPMAYIVGSERSALISGSWPSPVTIVGLALGGLATLAAGYAVYHSLRDRVPEQL